jgi:hypothetical protein
LAGFDTAKKFGSNELGMDLATIAKQHVFGTRRIFLCVVVWTHEGHRAHQNMAHTVV